MDGYGVIFCFLFPNSSKIVKFLICVNVQPSITYESIKNTRLILQKYPNTLLVFI